MNSNFMDRVLSHQRWLADENGVRLEQGTDSLYECLLRINRANLMRSDLHSMCFRECSFTDVTFFDADLSGCKFIDCSFDAVDFSSTNLSGAEFIHCTFKGIIANEFTLGYWPVCPTEGDFIGWKKCTEDKIVKLLITGKRSSSTTRKCRCSEAKVLEIYTYNGEVALSGMAFSKYDRSFVYRVGEVVSVDDFDEDRWNECSKGIHFFLTRAEAEEY